MESSCILFLNGYPGVGKLSIARAIQAKFPKDSTRLVDVHLIIDPALSVIPDRGSPAHLALRKDIRRVLFTALEQEFASNKNLMVIMTGCFSENKKEDDPVYAEYLELAQRSKVKLFCINVTCDKDEHIERLRDPKRYAQGKMKLDNPEVLEMIMEKFVLMGAAYARQVVDTTGLSVDEGSIKVLERMNRREKDVSVC